MTKKVRQLRVGDIIHDPRPGKSGVHQISSIEKVMDGIYDLESGRGFLGTWRGEKKVRMKT